jgi:hypothetical protein
MPVYSISSRSDTSFVSEADYFKSNYKDCESGGYCSLDIELQGNSSSIFWITPCNVHNDSEYTMQSKKGLICNININDK